MVKMSQLFDCFVKLFKFNVPIHTKIKHLLSSTSFNFAHNQFMGYNTLFLLSYQSEKWSFIAILLFISKQVNEV